MLSCKQVASLASQYLDKDTSTPLNWQIRLHLLMCANCRRFVRHLKITRTLAKNIELTDNAIDTETIWKHLQEKIQQEKSKNENNHSPENKSQE
ncbi:MAG: hypothetical protein B0W54_05185 [Cellvibrio sp. 79]|nr:MAG: hypothetical protein B0W54_05185 [Cellvibrio sp. 79]